MKKDDDSRPIGHPNHPVCQSPKRIPWLWEGVVAEEGITLLSAPEKIGKTTLLSLLLDRRRAGGQLLGRTVYPGKTILCTEENERLWALRQPPLDFGPHLIFHQPDDHWPSRIGWKRFIDDMCNLSFREETFDLLVIDTAVRFLPLAQRNPRIRNWALGQLRLVASFPASVLLINQSRNFHRSLAAFADIIITMDTPRGSTASRRRTFTGVGRYPGTLGTAAAELNSAGTDYDLLLESPAPHSPLLTTLQAVLGNSPAPLSRREVLDRWPGDPPRQDTLWRTLARGLELGLFLKSGRGTKTDAFRFRLRETSKEPNGA